MHFNKANKSAFLYSGAFAITCCGLAYSLVPLYKLICQSTAISGSPQTSPLPKKESITPVTGVAPITIKFIANRGKNMPWKFEPLQKTIQVLPGQTALAFYSAESFSDQEITGIATYNVIPARAALYFNKVQCFCFEEQRLFPGEQVDMPIFFYVDPEFAHDPALSESKEIVLSYTFFNSKVKVP